MHQWDVKLWVTGFTYKIFIYKDVGVDGSMDVLVHDDVNGWHVKRSPPPKPGEPDDPPASISFDVRNGQSILRGLASELASHGFSTLDPGGVSKAKDMHIASLEKQAERLFILAGGVHVKAGEVEVSERK